MNLISVLLSSFGFLGVLSANLRDSNDPSDPAYWTDLVSEFEAMFKGSATCTAITDCQACVDSDCGSLYLKSIGKFLNESTVAMTEAQKAKYATAFKSGFQCGIDRDQATLVKGFFDGAVSSGVIDLTDYKSFMIDDCRSLSRLIAPTLAVSAIAYLLI